MNEEIINILLFLFGIGLLFAVWIRGRKHVNK